MCNLAKLIRPTFMGLVANTPIFEEMKGLPLQQLDLYQLSEDLLPDLSCLACWKPTLKALTLATSWRNGLLSHFGDVFGSLRGVEGLKNLTKLRLARYAIADAAGAMLDCNFSSLPKLELISIFDFLDAETFFNLASQVHTPAILDVGVELIDGIDFFNQCGHLIASTQTQNDESSSTAMDIDAISTAVTTVPSPPRIRFEEFQEFRLDAVPVQFTQLRSIIYKTLAIMPNLTNLTICCVVPFEPVNIRKISSPESFMRLAFELEHASKLCTLTIWLSRQDPTVDLGITDMEYSHLYGDAVASYCESAGLRLQVYMN
ncbi:hypothetical protein HDU76_011832 [Blyttiomyces sp. JEL0837]|nr:hypothetical protein HDU76_011832 [Blyttiomyces sp. JEL0837]